MVDLGNGFGFFKYFVNGNGYVLFELGGSLVGRRRRSRRNAFGRFVVGFVLVVFQESFFRVLDHRSGRRDVYLNETEPSVGRRMFAVHTDAFLVFGIDRSRFGAWCLF